MLAATDELQLDPVQIEHVQAAFCALVRTDDDAQGRVCRVNPYRRIVCRPFHKSPAGRHHLGHSGFRERTAFFPLSGGATEDVREIDSEWKKDEDRRNADRNANAQGWKAGRYHGVTRHDGTFL